MRLFAQLCEALESPANSLKQAALAHYLAAAAAADAAWAVYLLTGGKLGKLVQLSTLRALVCRQAQVPDWLFETCYQSVGDLAETMALILPAAPPPSSTASDESAGAGLAFWVENHLLPLRALAPAEAAERVAHDWQTLDAATRLLLLKLAGGGFRSALSLPLLQHALAAQAGVEPALIAQRMDGFGWDENLPTSAAYLALLAAPTPERDRLHTGQPYAFASAQSLPRLDLQVSEQRDLDFDSAAEPGLAQLGRLSDWQLEWQFAGLRGQLVKRGGQVWLWSAEAALLNRFFPEILALAESLPDGTVLDGEILAWSQALQRPASRLLLTQRLGRKTPLKVPPEPALFMAFDLLEVAGLDWRAQPQQSRRQRLEQLLAGTAFGLSPLLFAADWAALDALRCAAGGGPRANAAISAIAVGTANTTNTAGMASMAKGLMLKKIDQPYASNSWWQWQAPAQRICAVLVYAQAATASFASSASSASSAAPAPQPQSRLQGAGTDYSFALWSRPPQTPSEVQLALEALAQGRPLTAPGALQLVTLAKLPAYLSAADCKQLERLVRQTTLAKFGPVRSLRPSLVCELAFDGLSASTRHKSGFALEAARLLRLRPELALAEAGSLAQLSARLGI